MCAQRNLLKRKSVPKSSGDNIQSERRHKSVYASSTLPIAWGLASARETSETAAVGSIGYDPDLAVGPANGESSEASSDENSCTPSTQGTGTSEQQDPMKLVTKGFNPALIRSKEIVDLFERCPTPLALGARSNGGVATIFPDGYAELVTRLSNMCYAIAAFSKKPSLGARFTLGRTLFKEYEAVSYAVVWVPPSNCGRGGRQTRKLFPPKTL